MSAKRKLVLESCMFEEIATSEAAANVELATNNQLSMAMQNFQQYLLANPNLAMALSFGLSAWILVWKGLALWRAAQKKQVVWFIILMCFNTLGLLEIIYFFWLSQVDWPHLGRKFGLVKPTVEAKPIKATAIKTPATKKITAKTTTKKTVKKTNSKISKKSK